MHSCALSAVFRDGALDVNSLNLDEVVQHGVSEDGSGLSRLLLLLVSFKTWEVGRLSEFLNSALKCKTCLFKVFQPLAKEAHNTQVMKGFLNKLN